MEAAQVPISRGVRKTSRGHLHNGKLLGCKKEEKLVWMGLENMVLSEISPLGKDKHLSLIHISEPTRH